jgi:PAS domain-containing protein
MKRVLILSSRQEIIERIREALKDPEIETEVPGSEEGTSPIQAADLFIVDAHFSKEMVSEQLLKANGGQPKNQVLVMGKEDPDEETEKIVSLIEGHWLSINEQNESLVRHCINLCYETERLKYERNTELRNYNSLLQDATEGIFGVNTNLEITEVNQAFLKLFDLSYGEVRGRSLADFIVSEKQFREKFTAMNDEEDFAQPDTEVVALGWQCRFHLGCHCLVEVICHRQSAC